MSDIQRIGPLIGATGSPTPFRADHTGASAISDAHGRYAEAARRGALFYAANQAAQAVSVALAAAYTGNVVSNPIGSKVNLELVSLGITLSVAPAAIATLGLIGGFHPQTDVAHTTPLTPRGTLLNAPGGVAKADASATLPLAPFWLAHLMGGFTAAALPSTTPMLIDLAGQWIVPPGGFIALGALTAVTGLFSFTWEEVPIPS